MKKMNRKHKNYLCISAGLLLLFLIWTVALCFVDVCQIGPKGTSVGFATVNQAVHDLTGVHLWLYVLTDWLGLVPVFLMMGFGLLGLIQWTKRKKLLKVDADILVLGIFYVIVLALYLFFEAFIINYRPILINNYLEASYPSSTTLLVLCVMPTAILQFHQRIRSVALRWWVNGFLVAFTVFMVLGRLVSGVHWLSDIIGGAMLSGGLVMLYVFVCLKGD